MAVCLAELIQHHQICYEVWPEWAMVDGRRVQIGFEVDLCAAARDEPDPSQFEQLKELAASVLTGDQSTTDFEILPFDNSVHESPRRGFRPEVVLGVQILHKHGSEQPVDDCEQQCLRDLEHRLRKLGIPRAN
jgi:hypothetical protein